MRPLTRQEERRLLTAWQVHQERGAAAQLAEAFKGAIWATARRWHARNPEMELDDLVQETWLGFLAALRTFDRRHFEAEEAA